MPKGVIVILVLMVLLFALAVGVGTTRAPTSPDPRDHGWVELFELGGAPAVELRDIQAGCLNRLARRLSIPPDDPCSAEIGPASEEIRLLTLESVTRDPPGVQVRLEPRAGQGARELDANGAGDFPVELPVGSRGATVTIVCRQLAGEANECLLELAR